MRIRLLVGTVYLATVGIVGSVGLHDAADAEEQAQAPSSQSAASSQHLYHLTAFRAAPGRMTELAKLLGTPAPQPLIKSDFVVVFRHREGHEWDLLLVEHIGEKLTLDVTAAPPAPQPDTPLSQLAAWHGDTFALGPPLEEFRRALNLQQGTASGQGGAKGVYVITDLMAAPGHRGKLRSTLDQLASETPGRSVTLTHVEGAPWTFLTITRYDSWRQFAEDREAQEMEEAKNPATPGAGVSLREHITMHHDTVATVAAIQSPGATR
jgi:hypothetical protein